ncbi:hypothetical protein GLOTRDRAFT_60082 [Gloeophyllum trabeum ATCC 11539]|uniref:Uncharacterized protein n=1 Tax=Gloeophyllum trabeum (strain ATCC 11539 / FP-39264 / Madison 617) TaxID=670483 RepID=S7QBF1_GLOTA|nr:uncharacterized protein GLOTRDRAFT_60082 [Gloeophyllum trabeum ATCC 11539]EPQ56677.1 hypothetical protein GLOTRDRAFT_60082 [Gloeophyllum trabeum ATCC 11539]
MDIEHVFQSFPELSRDAVENALADSLHEMLNTTCKNAHDIHEEHRKLQAELSGQEYQPLLSKGTDIPEYVPIQLLKDNIHTNGLDPDKWRSTIQAHATTKLEAYVSSISDPAIAKSSFDAVERFKASLLLAPSASTSVDRLLLISDRMANRNLEEVASSGSEETLAEPLLAVSKLAHIVKDDVSLQGIIIIPFAALLLLVIGSALYMELILLSSRYGHSFRVVLQTDETAFREAVRQLKEKIAQETAQQEQRDQANRDLREKQKRKQAERNRKRDKKREDDEQKAKRKDYYYGSVAMIIPLEGRSGDPRGYAVRIEAVKENLLGDDEVLQKIKRITVADNIIPAASTSIYCLEIYCHSLPSGIKAGTWVNLELDMKAATPATYAPVLPPEGSFDNGLCWVEVTSPYASFTGGALSNFGKTDNGFKATVDMAKITLDVPKTALDKLQILFERCQAIRHNITNFFRLSDVISKKSISLSQYKVADHYAMANVGQAAAGWIGSTKEKWGIISDYGFGKGDRDFTDMIDHFLRQTQDMPVILSHWDRDHYRIADSGRAKLVRGTGLCPTLRHWVVPDQPLTAKAFELACSIHAQGLLEWCTTDEYGPAGGNWRILRCQSTDKDDKNNSGALALVVGLQDDDRPLLYPGDANYEYIHNISELDGKLYYVIATHHGSEASLKVKYGGLGDSIPRSVGSAGDPAVYFSFGKGNSYGHSVERVVNLYKAQGYKKAYATADLASDEDLLIVGIGPNVLSQLPNPRPIPGVSEDIAIYHDIESYFAFMNGPSKSTDAPKVPRDNSAPPIVTDTITLDGAEHDPLALFAIRDEWQQIVKYRVLARKLIMRNCPLTVKCESDVPIQVLLQCEDIELYATTAAASTPEAFPVVLFDVRSGDPWGGYADMGGQAMAGNDGYMGGFVDIRVTGNWLVQIADKSVYKSGEPEQLRLHLEIQYRGGVGGTGEKGAHGQAGADGVNGTSDKCVVDTNFDPWSGMTGYSYSVIGGARATAGGTGGTGGTGGSGGRPSTFPVSQIIATKTKVPDWLQSNTTGHCFTVSVALLNNDGVQFGAQGKGGPGGEGGRGGHGGIQGKRFQAYQFPGGFTELKDEQSVKPAPDGASGPTGYPGPDSGVNPVDHGKLEPRVIICETEEETHERLMEDEFV